MISVLIATCGTDDWRELAWSRAYPSVEQSARQVRGEVIVEHLAIGTIAQARNYAASKAKNPWLCFLDADDELHPLYLVAMMRALATHGNAPDLYAPAVSYVTRAVEGMAPSFTTPQVPNTHMTMPPLNHCVIGTLVPRVVFDHVGGFAEGYYPWEDYELWLRCVSAGCTVRYVDEAIYLADVNPESAHRSLPRKDAVALASRIHREHRRRARA